jgi:hypothetical protein
MVLNIRLIWIRTYYFFSFFINKTVHESQGISKFTIFKDSRHEEWGRAWNRGRGAQRDNNIGV